MLYDVTPVDGYPTPAASNKARAAIAKARGEE